MRISRAFVNALPRAGRGGIDLLHSAAMSRGLLRSTLVTSSMTLLSRVTGLVRDIVLARMIGAGAGIAADAFYVAFRIPNFLRRIFGEGAFSQAFVPVFARYKARGDEQATRAFVDHVAGVLLSALLLVTLVVTLAAPFVVLALAPGFLQDPGKYALTVGMLRIMFPYLVFISLVAMAAGMLNTYGRFGIPAFTPVLLNLCMIAAGLWVAPHLAKPVMALAWAVFIAGVLQLAFQVPALRRLKLLPRPRVSFRDEGVRQIFRLMLPSIFSVSVAQVNLLVNTLLASFLVTGSVSWLYYSDRLMEFPLGLLGVALGTVILPALSEKHASASHDEFSHTLDWALRVAVLACVPAAVGLVVLAQPLLITLFQYGAFRAHDVAMSTSPLLAFSLGLPAFVLIKILAPAFYARHDMKTPVRAGVVSLVSNIGFSLALISPLAHTGLAAATSAAAAVNAGLLYVNLRRVRVYAAAPGWPALLLKVVVASVLMGAVLWTPGMDTASWLAAGPLARVARLGFWVMIGIVVYAGVLLLTGVRPAELWLRPGVRRAGERE